MSIRKVGYEMAVHYFHVNPVGAHALGLGDLFTQPGKVGAKDRRWNFVRFLSIGRNLFWSSKAASQMPIFVMVGPLSGRPLSAGAPWFLSRTGLPTLGRKWRSAQRQCRA